MKPESLGSINAFVKSTFWVTTKTGKKFWGNFNGTTLDLNRQLAHKNAPVGSLIITDIFQTNRYHWDGKAIQMVPKPWSVILIPAPGLTKKQLKELSTGKVLCETYTERDAREIAKMENQNRVKSGNPYRLQVRKK